MTKSVTFPGDVFEPRGLLTGGSRKYVLLLGSKDYVRTIDFAPLLVK